MKKIIAALSISAAALSLTATPAHAEDPAKVVVLFSRSMLAPAVGCKTAAGSVRFPDVVDYLQTRGIPVTASGVVDRIAQTTPTCANGSIYAPWDVLDRLKNRDRLQMSSHGLSHAADFNTETPEQQKQESCGSISAFTAHGFDPTAMYMAPSGQISNTSQDTVVSTCFRSTRVYGRVLNTLASFRPHFFLKAWGVTGGRCANALKACSGAGVAATAYDQPSALITYLQGGAGTVAMPQFYELVTGKTAQHDCTSPDPADHWTGGPAGVEEYCWEDFQKVIEAIPSTSIVTTPAAVVGAWGR